MQKSKKSWIGWLANLRLANRKPAHLGLATLLLACAISGCGTIEHRYPLYEVPPRPAVHFEDTGTQCLDDNGLRQLTGYVIQLEGTLQKYRKEIEIINGD